jgi:FKBP-type peptidyl-prolyl cis-trans isomerase FkpA
MLRKCIVGLFIICVLNSCSKKADTDYTCSISGYDPCAIKAPAAEVQAVKDYLAANSITATEHCSGLSYIIDAAGSGKTADPCSTVTVTYEGKLTNGTTFDKNTTGVSFLLGQLIKGWIAGIPLIKPGGSIRLYIPPSLGYGSSGYGSIPGNSILVFRVDLIAVN